MSRQNVRVNKTLCSPKKNPLFTPNRSEEVVGEYLK